MALEKINLEKWKFASGEERACLENGREVRIPHTWNVEEGTEEYWGTGWYSYSFVPEDEWEGKRLHVLFHAVYHDAAVYLNGKELGNHKNSGYTPFTLELTDEIRYGEENQLAVKVDNRFSDQMLPFERSFDWANDGGIIRPAELLITGEDFLKNLQVRACPVITLRETRQDQGNAVFGFYGEIDRRHDGRPVNESGREGNGKDGEELWLEWALYDGCDGDLEPVCDGREHVTGAMAEIPGKVLPAIKYWHFDSPALYTLKLSLKRGERLLDVQETVFGFRDFCVQGGRFFLNGEPVRLPGTEWMPGSDPRYGMAEPKEQLEKMLLCLKESNSVLTRFHWQQDDWVYDWCDRHGMMVQEEVPFWGKHPLKAGTQQWDVFKKQIAEMVASHRNHPSIIAWGVGNELDGQCEETIQYIKDAVAYVHRLDPGRTANYVTNTIYRGHSSDGTTDGDVMMINDYIGTWHEGYDQYQEWDAIVKHNPDKAVIPSEFGLCEPAFSGGDERRKRIFREKMECYRKYPNIAGTIYFCLNDYRTQMGEDGNGKLRKRVHGSAGLCGEIKPSYLTVRTEYSPLILKEKGGALTIVCRDDIPSYTVKGYFLEAGNEKIQIPDMRPGDTWSLQCAKPEDVENVRVYRPNGERVL